MARLARVVGAIGATLVGLTALIGALHHPAARGALASVGGCPVPMDVAADAATLDARRVSATAGLAGEGRASAVLPVGVELGVTDRAAWAAWATTHGGRCEAARDRRGVVCSDVVVDGVSTTIAADVDASERIVAVSVLERANEAGSALRSFDAIEVALRPTMGEPTRSVGDATPEWLQAAPARQRRVEWRRENLFARVSVTHLGDGSFVVSQVFQAVGA